VPSIPDSQPVEPRPPVSALQRLCLASLVVVFALIVVGVTVRATGSGLGCPEWPRCDGSFIPRWEKHTLIEYSHRLTATVAGLLILALTVTAWRGYRRVPAILYPATAALVLVVAQAGLGGATVLGELPPELVALHLAMAMAILALLLLTTTAAFAQQRALVRPAVSPAFAKICAATGIALFFVMLVGSYVAGAGYSLACSGWPLCNGQLIPADSVASVQVHFLHRALALGAGVLMAALLLAARRQRRQEPQVERLVFAIAGLFLLQALVGAANIWTDAKDVVHIAHLATGTLLWSLVAYLNIRVFQLHALFPSYRPLASVERDLAGATR
jgi:heme A synthase